MPNGYTAAIHDGSDTSLRGFLTRMGRGYGFAIMQRDDDPKAPVKEQKPSTSYYDKMLVEATTQLRFVTDLRDDQCEALAAKEVKDNLQHRKESAAEADEMRARYDDMIAQVKAWEPGEVIGSITLKDDAIKALEESKQFDCPVRDEDDYVDNRFWPIDKLTGREWRDREIAQAKKDIDYAIKNRDEEIDRTNERNKYIKAFNDVLPEA